MIKKTLFIKKAISFAAALAIVCAAAGCSPAADAPGAAPAASSASAQTTNAANGSLDQSTATTQPSNVELRADAAKAREELRQSATYGEEVAFFLKKYGSVLTEAQTDDALLLLEDVLEREKELLAPDYEYANADDTFKEAFKNGFFRQNTYLLSEELLALVEGTLLDGFKLVKADDGLAPVVDYAALLARYGEFCSSEYREYLELCTGLPAFVFASGEEGEEIEAEALKSSIAAFESHAEKYPHGVTNPRVRSMLDILKRTNIN